MSSLKVRFASIDIIFPTRSLKSIAFSSVCRSNTVIAKGFSTALLNLMALFRCFFAIFAFSVSWCCSRNSLESNLPRLYTLTRSTTIPPGLRLLTAHKLVTTAFKRRSLVIAMPASSTIRFFVRFFFPFGAPIRCEPLQKLNENLANVARFILPYTARYALATAKGRSPGLFVHNNRATSSL